MPPTVELRDVTAGNRRACADLEVADAHAEFVTPVTRYLCLCHYGGVWRPLAVYPGEECVGFVETGEREEDELVARLPFPAG